MAKPAKIRTQYLKGLFLVTLKITICKYRCYTCCKPMNYDITQYQKFPICGKIYPIIAYRLQKEHTNCL